MADYHLVMSDARGHGRSDAPEMGYAVEGRVVDLVGVVDALDIADPILLGHSICSLVTTSFDRTPNCYM